MALAVLAAVPVVLVLASAVLAVTLAVGVFLLLAAAMRVGRAQHLLV